MSQSLIIYKKDSSQSCNMFIDTKLSLYLLALVFAIVCRILEKKKKHHLQQQYLQSPPTLSRLGMLFFFQRIFNVVIWQMKDESIKPEEPEEEEKAEGGEEYRKTIAHLSQDIFLFTCSGTLNCILYLV